MPREFRFFAGPLCAVMLLFTVACNKDASKRKYYALGKQSFDKGDFKKAEIALRNAVKIDVRYGEAQFLLGRTHMQRGRFDRGIQSLRRAALLMPDNTEVRVVLGDFFMVAYAAGGRNSKEFLGELQEVTRHLVAKAPGTFDTLRFQGFVALAENKLEEGIEYLSKAQAAKPWQRAVVFQLARALMVDQQGAEGEKLALALLEREKTYAPIYDLLYGYYRSENRVNDAESILKSKIASNPKAGGYRIHLAAHYAGIKKTAEMTATLKEMLDKPGDFPAARLEIGDFYGRLGNWAEAVRQYEAGAKLDPKLKNGYRKRIAMALVAQQKPAEAEKVLDGILKETPKDLDARAAWASLQLGKGSKEGIAAAMTEFQALVKQAPENVYYRFDLGRAYMANGVDDEAQKEFRAAINRRAEFTAARLALAEVSMSRQEYKEALQQADEVLKIAPNLPQARLLRISALVGLGNTIQARPELNALLKDAPRYGEAYLQLGLMNLAERRLNEADKVLRGLYRPGQSDPRLVRALSQLELARGSTDKALQVLKSEIDRKPYYESELRWSQAQILALAGRTDEAIQEYMKVLPVSRRPGAVHYRLSELYFQKGEENNSIAELEKAKQQDPRNPQVLLVLGSLVERQGRMKEAQDYYRQTLVMEPDNGVAMNNLAYNLADSGVNLDEALKLAQQATQRHPQEAAVSDTLGWVYLKRGMPAPATQIFQGLAQKYPDNPTFRYHYGLALMQNGDKAKAKAELEAALTKKPSRDEEAKIRAAIGKIG